MREINVENRTQLSTCTGRKKEEKRKRRSVNRSGEVFAELEMSSIGCLQWEFDTLSRLCCVLA